MPALEQPLEHPAERIRLSPDSAMRIRCAMNQNDFSLIVRQSSSADTGRWASTISATAANHFQSANDWWKSVRAVTC